MRIEFRGVGRAASDRSHLLPVPPAQSHPSRLGEGDDPLANLPVKHSGQQAVSVVAAAAPRWPQINSRPDELIEVTGDNPGAGGVQSKPPLGLDRNFDGEFGPIRRGMGDRRHRDNDLSADVPHRQNDDARPIFDPVVSSAQGFVAPEIGVADHKPRLGRRQGQRLFDFVVEPAGGGRRFRDLQRPQISAA